MMFSVPQFIDVEDKIAGPLTWKQLGWMIGMGAVVLAIFAIFDTSLAIVFTVPTVLLFSALAFYKPDGFTMTSFIANSFLFFFRPKIAVWERPVVISSSSSQTNVNEVSKAAPVVEKKLTRDKIAELARIIDQR